MNKVAVALSVYKADKPSYISSSVESILQQSHSNFILFIQVDGKVSEDIQQCLEKYSADNRLEIIYNETNRGLAYRLNQIIDLAIESGDFDYLARMDADDISLPERFEKQVEFLNDNPTIDVVGSSLIEFSECSDEEFYKRMDVNHSDMLEKIIKKCPFNHPTVMFRMQVFEDGFKYDSNLMNTQDYYLWVDLLANNKQFANIDLPLLKFRINDSFHSRRGLKKAINDVKSRLYAVRKLDLLTFSNILHVILLFILRVSPSYVKKIAYKYLR